jgi:HD-GYP domain-containing protein (c-di-GMP phosphodiesterase class II)
MTSKDYVSNHSVLNIYFSSYLLTKLNWSNEQSLRQMIYACFYHDFEVEDHNLAHIDRLEELPPTADLKSYKDHPKRAAKLTEELKGLNHDAYKIVLDHHEKPD